MYITAAIEKVIKMEKHTLEIQLVPVVIAYQKFLTRGSYKYFHSGH